MSTELVHEALTALKLPLIAVGVTCLLFVSAIRIRHASGLPF
jgi:hypothetical protein